jgi:ribonuclease J
MRVCIHRGTKEIGGTCIEIESEGKRIVLDVGLPLDAEDSIRHLPSVKGFREPDESLLAVVLSHPHQDHYGLSRYIQPQIQMIMGPAAERILKASALFTPTGAVFKHVLHLEHGKTQNIGPFAITSYLNDHSAYDAYSLLVEADGQRLFYSGDFRGHGQKAGLFERFLKCPPSNVDVLLMEGTTIGRSSSDDKFKTEQELERCFLEHIDKSKGMVLVWTSGQNIDRLVTLFKAVKRSGRQLIMDMYTAEILRETGNPKLPQGTWKGVRVFLPESQKKQIKKSGQYDLTRPYKPNRTYTKDLAGEASRSVMLFRPSMSRELEKARCLKDARLIYSLWHGYLERDEHRSFREWLNKHNIPLHECHTSGHASTQDLQRFAKAIAPKMLVPIHSYETNRFKEYFDNVERKEDGQWWEVLVSNNDTGSAEISILAGANNLIDSALCLNSVGASPHYAHKKSCMKLKAPDAFTMSALVETIYKKICSNWSKGECRGERNWRWEKKKEFDTESAEVVLERVIVNATGNDWVNQVPTSSGLTKVVKRRQSTDKRSAVDLIHRAGKHVYEFVELKIGSNTPLYASMEILLYGLLYAFYRENLKSLESVELEVDRRNLFEAKVIHLQVLAPRGYYVEKKNQIYDLGPFETAINQGLETFDVSRKLGFRMDFRFLQFPAGFPAETVRMTPEEIARALDGITRVYT